MRKLFSKLGAFVACLGMGLAGLAVAASVSLFTGPSGSNPAGFPAALQDLNQLIINLNTAVAPAGSGGMSTAVSVSTSAGVNLLLEQGAASLAAPTLGVTGPDTGINLAISPKGTGALQPTNAGSYTGPKGGGSMTLSTIQPNVTLGSQTVKFFLTFIDSAGTLSFIPVWQ